jgi:hypothetical protein
MEAHELTEGDRAFLDWLATAAIDHLLTGGGDEH